MDEQVGDGYRVRFALELIDESGQVEYRSGGYVPARKDEADLFSNIDPKENEDECLFESREAATDAMSAITRQLRLMFGTVSNPRRK